MAYESMEEMDEMDGKEWEEDEAVALHFFATTLLKTTLGWMPPGAVAPHFRMYS